MLIPSQAWGEDIPIDSRLVKHNLNSIETSIAHCQIKIIAVTKYFGLKAIEAGYEAGIRDFAESRAQDGIKKLAALSSDVKADSTFHFIGHLQSNKVSKVVRFFDVIQSVDSLKLAANISSEACSLDKREKILLQVNNAGEEQKTGFAKEELLSIMPELLNLQGIKIEGIMNMAPLGVGEGELRRLFKDIREYRDELERRFGCKLPELSMGMSDDYKIAVAEGATMIRIGRKLFT